MNKIRLSYDPATRNGKFLREEGISDGIWIRVRSAARDTDARARIQSHAAEVSWPSALSLLRTLSPLQEVLDFEFYADDSASSLLDDFRKDVEAVAITTLADFSDESSASIFKRLAGFGWRPERPLKPYQMANLQQLLTLRNGANFSVPGAGKTTVSLALHLLNDDVAEVLFVVAPRNAFPAWETVVSECLVPGSNRSKARFIPLVGGERKIGGLLAGGHRRYIISYDQLIRVEAAVETYLANHKTHLLLDESHRMKAGAQVQRGAALLRMGHLAVRRDILSGTPMPLGKVDLQSQLDFLWPGAGLGSQIARGSSAKKVLGNLFVRTTKKDLQLPRRDRKIVTVRLTDAHLAFYSVLKDDMKARGSELRRGRPGAALIRARKSVIRLLQAAVNPVLVASTLGEVINGEKAGALLQVLRSEGPSARLRVAVDLAEKLIGEGKKVLIWTIFTDSVHQLRDLLKKHNPAAIYGAVALGDETAEETRQGQLKKFKSQESCKVMIANPAAAAEGISLHMHCHDAIYVDRSYNATHYLQSIDRIHRLGLPQDVVTTIYVLENLVPSGVGSIDRAVSRSLSRKIRAMEDLLDDPDLHRLALDEDERPDAFEKSVELRDVLELVAEIEGNYTPEETRG